MKKSLIRNALSFQMDVKKLEIVLIKSKVISRDEQVVYSSEFWF